MSRNVQVAEVSLPGMGHVVRSIKRPIVDLELKSVTRELGKSAPDCRFLLEDVPAFPVSQ